MNTIKNLNFFNPVNTSIKNVAEAIASKAQQNDLSIFGNSLHVKPKAKTPTNISTPVVATGVTAPTAVATPIGAKEALDDLNTKADIYYEAERQLRREEELTKKCLEAYKNGSSSTDISKLQAQANAESAAKLQLAIAKENVEEAERVHSALYGKEYKPSSPVGAAVALDDLNTKADIYYEAERQLRREEELTKKSLEAYKNGSSSTDISKLQAQVNAERAARLKFETAKENVEEADRVHSALWEQWRAEQTPVDET